MIIRTVKADDIPPAKVQNDTKLKKSIVKDTIESFRASSANAIEVIDDEHLWANSNNFRRSFQSYLNNNNITSAFVTIRGNRVFLIKGSLQ